MITQFPPKTGQKKVVKLRTEISKTEMGKRTILEPRIVCLFVFVKALQDRQIFRQIK